MCFSFRELLEEKPEFDHLYVLTRKIYSSVSNPVGHPVLYIHLWVETRTR